MREILFRGQRLDNGEWVEGYLLNAYTIGSVGSKLSHYNYADIDPETLGQYTGLKDSNGVKIFEGDKANLLFEGEWLDGYQLTADSYECFEVTHQEGAFHAVFDHETLYLDEYFGCPTDVTIIGNIHET